jgi:hypothetical protein
MHPGAINIAAATAGSVVVDMKGFAITGPRPWESGGITIGIIIGINGSGVPNTYPITVRNGTVVKIGIGVQSLAMSILPSAIALLVSTGPLMA